MGRYVYGPGGQRMWVETGGPESAATGQSGAPEDAGGFEMGGSGKYGGHPTNVTGLPGFYRNLEHARLLWEDAANPNQITAAQADPVAMNRDAEMATRAKQYEMLAAYERMAAGGGPSVAGHATREGMDATGRAMMGSGAGLRGTLAAGSAMGSDAAFKGAAAKAGEQQGAWGALASAAGGVRGADLAGNVEAAKLQQQIALANSGFRQQAGIANQDARLAALGNRVASAQQYGGLVADNRTAKTTRWGIGVQEAQNDLKKRMDDQDRDDREVAAAIKTGGQLMMLGASDERTKHKVTSTDKKLRDMYGALAPYEYEYKDASIEGASPGKHVSVMAQDLEKSEIGKKAVSESKQGHKMVDYAKLMPAQVAATAWLHKRVEDLEDHYRALMNDAK